MRLPRRLLQYMAESVVVRLARDGMVEVDDSRRLIEIVESLIEAELEKEADLEEEARELLSRHYDQVRAAGAEYYELFKKVRAKLARDRGFTLSGGDGRAKLSDDKITNLSHIIADSLAGDERVAFRQAYNSVRGAVRAAIAGAMLKDVEITGRAEGKVRTLKRRVPEGSQEWEVLFRKYYQEEIDRLRSLR